MNTNQPTATATPKTDPYTSGFTTTPREAALFKSVACGCASVGMLYDEGLKEAVYGSVRIDLIMWERELSSAQAALAEAKAEVARLKEDYLKAQSLAAAMLAKSNDELTALRAELQQISDILPKRGHDTIGSAKDVMQDLAELRARVAELEQDKARLDWLLHQYSFADGRTNAPALRWGLSNHGRAAIDAARKGTE